jgi:hypothetical protein
MKSLILYGSPIKLTNAHKLVTTNATFKQPAYYVRADLFHGGIDSALQKAKPMTGETVLNTVEISGCEGHSTERMT